MRRLPLSLAALALLAAPGARAADAGAEPAAAAAPAAAAPAADAPTVGARVDKNEVRVGDVVILTVTAVGPSSTPVNLPAKLDLAPFELLDPEREEVEKDLGDGRISRSFRLKIAAYEPGEVSIPAVGVTYIGKDGHVLTTETLPVPVKITSLLANDPEPKLRELASPVEVLEEDLTLAYVAAGLGAAALGGLFALQIRRKIRARAAYRPPPPPRPAHEIALEKLDRLAGGAFGPEADHRQFYFQLSEVVREYFGSRFGFEALEMTTEELIAQLGRRAPRGVILGEISGWLSGCDLVKFAKVAPTPAEARGALETAIRVVEATRPRSEPQVSAGPVPAAAEAPHV